MIHFFESDKSGCQKVFFPQKSKIKSAIYAPIYVDILGECFSVKFLDLAQNRYERRYQQFPFLF